MAFEHDVEALQQAADYLAIRRMPRKDAIKHVIAAVVLLCFGIISGWASMPVARVWGSALFLAGLPLLIVSILALGLLLVVKPRPWFFIVTAVKYFIASLVFLVCTIFALLASVIDLLHAGGSGALVACLVIGPLLFGLTIVAFIRSGLREIAVYGRFPATQMCPPQPSTLEKLNYIKHEILSAPAKDDERILLFVFEASEAKARLQDDLAIVVFGEGWHVVFAKPSEVHFTPSSPPKPGRPCRGLLQLRSVRLKGEMEPDSLTRLDRWLSAYKKPDTRLPIAPSPTTS